MRVNQKNFEEAYINNPDGDSYPDILIFGLQHRNRAFMDDVVVVELNERNQWTIRNSTINSMAQLQVSPAKSSEGQRRQNFRLISDLVDKSAIIPGNRIQKTGKVVYISEKKGSRTAVGFLRVSKSFKLISSFMILGNTG